MVMFRDFVTRNARSRRIVGSVKNNVDGSVSIVAEGEEDKLVELLKLVHKGSLLSRVDTISEKWSEGLGKYKSFDILYK